MTQRKPPGMGFESWVEQQIGEAVRRGELDNLPGAGKPLPAANGPDDENWWLRSFLARQEVDVDLVLPPALQLRKEIERLRDTVVVLRSEQEVREAVAQLNARVRESWRTTTAPFRPVRLVNADAVVEQWRTDLARTASQEQHADVEARTPAPRRRRWWRIARHRRAE
jgi:DnaJ-like protein